MHNFTIDTIFVIFLIKWTYSSLRFQHLIILRGYFDFMNSLDALNYQLKSHNSVVIIKIKWIYERLYYDIASNYSYIECPGIQKEIGDRANV